MNKELNNKWEELAKKMYGELSVASYDTLIDLMCRFGNEVEKQTELEINDILREEGIYTRRQVDKFLEEQRELCAKNANLKEHHLFGDYKIIKKKDYRYHDSLSIEINDLSILNSKLNINKIK